MARESDRLDPEARKAVRGTGRQGGHRPSVKGSPIIIVRKRILSVRI
jgi:hypothetical protein